MKPQSAQSLCALRENFEFSVVNIISSKMIFLKLPENKSPYFYAAAEEWLVRNLSVDKETYVLLYVNRPCVVVGKNQCVWKEVNWNYLQNSENLVVRRVSGGGTVYHDLGNLCFSFIAKFENERVNNYKWFNEPIVKALYEMGISATFSERNDILFETKKISGNAQFTNRKNILSHGTILFDSDLEKLRSTLKTNEFDVQSKAVSSVRSSVMNLSEKLAVNFEEFTKQFQQFLPISSIETVDEKAIVEIEKSASEKYSSFEWIFAKSPVAQVQKNGISFTIENGLLQNIHANIAELSALENTPFLLSAVNEKITTMQWDETTRKNAVDLLF